MPLPHEVRCMTFDALAHRATAIMYFSYWPQAPTDVGVGRGAEQGTGGDNVAPFLIAKDGKEIEIKSSDPAIHVRRGAWAIAG